MNDAALDDGGREPTDGELLLATRLFTGVADERGRLNAVIQAPGHVFSAGKVYVKTQLIGVANTSVTPLVTMDDGSKRALWTFGPAGISTEVVPDIDPMQLQNDGNSSFQNRNATSGNYYLQPFGAHYHWFFGHMPATQNAQCDIFNTVAGELCTSDVQKSDIARLQEIVAEGSQPSAKYLEADASQSNLIFDDKANVIVTFLHEGAGYQNTFGLSLIHI